MSVTSSTAPSPRSAGVLLAGATLVFGIVWVSILIAGPETVPGHFGADGTPTRWDPTIEFLGIMALVAGGMAVLFTALPVIMARVPIEHVNVPNREQWNTPARRAHLDALVTEDLRLIGTGTMLLLAAVLVVSGYVGLGGQAPGWLFIVMMGTYLGALALVLGRMVLGTRYTPPA